MGKPGQGAVPIIPIAEVYLHGRLTSISHTNLLGKCIANYAHVKNSDDYDLLKLAESEKTEEVVTPEALGLEGPSLCYLSLPTSRASDRLKALLACLLHDCSGLFDGVPLRVSNRYS
jgi:hypothetical protein